MELLKQLLLIPVIVIPFVMMMRRFYTMWQTGWIKPSDTIVGRFRQILTIFWLPLLVMIVLFGFWIVFDVLTVPTVCC